VPEGQRELGRLRQRWHGNSKISLKETGCEFFQFELIDGDSNFFRIVGKILPHYTTSQIVLY
jgi:hypothetical protein